MTEFGPVTVLVLTHERVRVIERFESAHSPGTPDTGLGGINASGSISNCPIMVVFPGGVSFSESVETRVRIFRFISSAPHSSNHVAVAFSID